MASAVPEGNAAVAGPPTATMPTASIAENPEEHQQMKYEMRTATVFPIVESAVAHIIAEEDITVVTVNQPPRDPKAPVCCDCGPKKACCCMKLWAIWCSMYSIAVNPFMYIAVIGIGAFVWFWIATGLLCMYIPCFERCVIRNKCGCDCCLACMFDDFDDKGACCKCGLRPPRRCFEPCGCGPRKQCCCIKLWITFGIALSTLYDPFAYIGGPAYPAFGMLIASSVLLCRYLPCCESVCACVECCFCNCMKAQMFDDANENDCGCCSCALTCEALRTQPEPETDEVPQLTDLQVSTVGLLHKMSIAMLVLSFTSQMCMSTLLTGAFVWSFIPCLTASSILFFWTRPSKMRQVLEATNPGCCMKATGTPEHCCTPCVLNFRNTYFALVAAITFMVFQLFLQVCVVYPIVVNVAPGGGSTLDGLMFTSESGILAGQATGERNYFYSASDGDMAAQTTTTRAIQIATTRKLGWRRYGYSYYHYRGYGGGDYASNQDYSAGYFEAMSISEKRMEVQLSNRAWNLFLELMSTFSLLANLVLFCIAASYSAPSRRLSCLTDRAKVLARPPPRADPNARDSRGCPQIYSKCCCYFWFFWVALATLLVLLRSYRVLGNFKDWKWTMEDVKTFVAKRDRYQCKEPCLFYGHEVLELQCPAGFGTELTVAPPDTGACGCLDVDSYVREMGSKYLCDSSKVRAKADPKSVLMNLQYAHLKDYDQTRGVELHECVQFCGSGSLPYFRYRGPVDSMAYKNKTCVCQGLSGRTTDPRGKTTKAAYYRTKRRYYYARTTTRGWRAGGRRRANDATTIPATTTPAASTTSTTPATTTPATSTTSTTPATTTPAASTTSTTPATTTTLVTTAATTTPAITTTLVTTAATTTPVTTTALATTAATTSAPTATTPASTSTVTSSISTSPSASSTISITTSAAKATTAAAATSNCNALRDTKTLETCLRFRKNELCHVSSGCESTCAGCGPRTTTSTNKCAGKKDTETAENCRKVVELGLCGDAEKGHCDASCSGCVTIPVTTAKNAETTTVSIGTISGKVNDYKYHMSCILRSDFGCSETTVDVVLPLGDKLPTEESFTKMSPSFCFVSKSCKAADVIPADPSSADRAKKFVFARSKLNSRKCKASVKKGVRVYGTFKNTRLTFKGVTPRTFNLEGQRLPEFHHGDDEHTFDWVLFKARDYFWRSRRKKHTRVPPRLMDNSIGCQTVCREKIGSKTVSKTVSLKSVGWTYNKQTKQCQCYDVSDAAKAYDLTDLPALLTPATNVDSGITLLKNGKDADKRCRVQSQCASTTGTSNLELPRAVLRTSGSCPSGTSILTRDECVTAAKSLGLKYRDITQAYSMRYPRSCTFSGSTLWIPYIAYHWQSGRSECSSTRSCLCRAQTNTARKTKASPYEGFTKKYSREWPNCRSIKCMRTHITSFVSYCKRSTRCSGFTFNSGSTYGYGCMKDCRGGEYGGYGRGRYDYWARDFEKWGGAQVYAPAPDVAMVIAGEGPAATVQRGVSFTPKLWWQGKYYSVCARSSAFQDQRSADAVCKQVGFERGEWSLEIEKKQRRSRFRYDYYYASRYDAAVPIGCNYGERPVLYCNESSYGAVSMNCASSTVVKITCSGSCGPF